MIENKAISVQKRSIFKFKTRNSKQKNNLQYYNKFKNIKIKQKNLFIFSLDKSFYSIKYYWFIIIFVTFCFINVTTANDILNLVKNTIFFF